ncbi:MAG: glycosyltransferase family 4 protein [Prosthecobacter sp.]
MNLPEDKTVPRFVVAQTGARRGYAVPLILEKADMFERLYTDVCGNVGWGRWLTALSGLPWVGKKLRSLGNRRIPEAIRKDTVTFARPNIEWMLRSCLAQQDSTEQFRLQLNRYTALGKASSAKGFGKATHLYVMLNEYTTLMRAARAQGLKVVSEIYILMSTQRLLKEESLRFPGWGGEVPDFDLVMREFGWEGAPIGDADLYICPSEAVADDLVENWNVDRSATCMVPYGMNPSWLQLIPAPQTGRVLFVGTADLRKGIHYLAMAAEKLNAQGFHYEFRVAGHVTEQVRQQPICRYLNFLGRIPRDCIHEEFQQADLFVLPSLAEGSAEVTYEALAAALPLVVTKAAGSVVRDGVEGIIIPERDPHALGDAIHKIIEDRALRSRMASASRERARDFTWEKYGERLVGALKGMKS